MRLSEREFANLGIENKTRLKGTKETDIQNAIRDYLKWHGWLVIRHQQTLGSHKGLSDLTALKDGWTVYIEVKTPRGTRSQDQIDFCNDVIKHGGTYVLARSINDVKFLCITSDIRQFKGKAIGC